ncbi:MAG: UDP-N-acetylmuramate dehydrogenase [Clostridia bacterium]|nr:UDP-N-acetylmuramate dehydrogenase [Clostridium sp.]MEE0127005.1 UDP-N-acetylmuramate dehydrogenase [Clostridia bacterium]
MNIENHIEELKKCVSEETSILENELMSKHTSFKIGGMADIFVNVKKEDDVKKVLEYSDENQIPLTIIGNGSNLLVKDGGIRGIVLRVDIEEFYLEKKDEEYIVTVGAGVKNGYVAQKLLIEEIEGFEFAAGIPGSIGGAIRMNAGAHGGEMKNIVLETKCIDKKGNIKILSNEEQKFEYRNSIFSTNEYIILSTKLRLNKGIYKEIKSKMDEYSVWRKEHQPLEYPSAGSTFKRGEDFITAKLIDECGLKGYNIGGAEVSTKHAGFVVNKGDAKAKDVLNLTKYISQMIYEKFGKKVELEVQVIGED